MTYTKRADLIYNSSSDDNIACLQVSNPKQWESNTNTRCDRGHCRSYFYCLVLALRQPPRQTPGSWRHPEWLHEPVLQPSASRALRAHSHDHLLSPAIVPHKSAENVFKYFPFVCALFGCTACSPASLFLCLLHTIYLSIFSFKWFMLMSINWERFLLSINVCGVNEVSVLWFSGIKWVSWM